MYQLRDLPAAICDNCGRKCITLDQAGGEVKPGIKCYWCYAGRFRHRSLWDWYDCIACAGRDPRCEFCHGIGLLGVPMEVDGRGAWVEHVPAP